MLGLDFDENHEIKKDLKDLMDKVSDFKETKTTRTQMIMFDKLAVLKAKYPKET